MVSQEITDKIHKALDEIRPFLQSDGGDISLVDVTEDLSVVVKLHGACIGCRVNQMTLKSGVEMTIRKYLPDIKNVVQEDALDA
jgi:Fe-S cluster biogenesis protein NfuA